MKLKRKYLTSEEVAYIIATALTKGNSFERRVLVMGLVAQILIEDLPTFDTCDEIYDYLMEHEYDLYAEVVNIYDIDECIAEELGVANTVKNFLADMEVKLDELGKSVDAENMANLIEQFKGIGDVNAKL